jgi:glycogen(starch) synthase
VFVLPSLAEASGSISVLEALGSGIAVVASRCDGIPEDLRDGQDALLVKPGDHRALAEALGALLSDGQRRARLGDEAAATYRQRFSPTGFRAALENTYSECGLSPVAPSARLSLTASTT